MPLAIPQPEDMTTSAAAIAVPEISRGRRVDMFGCPMPDDATRVWKMRRPDREVPRVGKGRKTGKIEGRKGRELTSNWFRRPPAVTRRPCLVVSGGRDAWHICGGWSARGGCAPEPPLQWATPPLPDPAGPFSRPWRKPRAAACLEPPGESRPGVPPTW
ncbi:hypothetical protein GCM10009525_33510 [Streptosporangium amethystogenes subsp. fukuiense]